MAPSETQIIPSLSTLKILTDRYRHDHRFFLLTNSEETEIYLAYKIERDYAFAVITLEEYQNVQPANEYDTARQYSCEFCNQHNKPQIAGSPNKPDFKACYDCHNLLRETFDEMLKETNAHEIVSRHI